MMCLKCGNEIKDNEQICGKCGHNKNNIPTSDNSFSTVNRGVYNPNPVNKEQAEKVLEEQKQFDELLQIYIGNKYYNFKSGKFSWCAFFLSYIYFMYRKMYAVGSIVFVLNLTINLIFKNNLLLNTIIGLAFNLFLGIIFKKLYFNECVERIAKIRHNNTNLGFNQLTELVRRKGGVNTAIIIPFIIIYALILLLMVWSILIISNLATIA